MGKRALVTGGTRGIGAAIVRQLLDAGAEVLTTARSSTSAAPGDVGFVAADVRTRAGVEALATTASEQLGEVDILVHNAGGVRCTAALPAAILGSSARSTDPPLCCVTFTGADALPVSVELTPMVAVLTEMEMVVPTLMSNRIIGPSPSLT